MGTPFPVSNNDRFVLAATIYLEARGEPEEGRIGVGYVVRNRAQHVLDHGSPRIFGNGSIASAALFPWQFSCWNSNSPEAALAQRLTLDTAETDADFSACLSIADKILSGLVDDPTNGSMWYYAPSKGLVWPKGWGEEVEPTEVIGRHCFFNRLAE